MADPEPPTPPSFGMLDMTEQHGGLEKPPDGLDTKHCPKCGSTTEVGYGMMGGGVGTYVYCDGDCDWFYKEQDKEDRG